ncbi:uncharacterized protein LOC133392100 [Anopheles gambiae]|uniref:uncharacterized protein LOC133392100 n=1 Tax=Anopheles gambiae TaxID=7165 RepID=UPI002AC8FE8E|nr:uncharacterized protein LOC133392100 [Anopheles gambiae]XP_061506576.1 uncharacterized protein LOC133392100 [Anopheles gambiae]
MTREMSGKSIIYLDKNVPPPLVPLSNCHARAIPTSYIANCRLCLGTEFGNRCTTIIDESLITMMKQVFPIVIVNQIGLPMNVCTECVKTVETFYVFSSQVLANQNKLLATLPDVIRPVQNNDGVECRENPIPTQKAQENVPREEPGEPEVPIDSDLLIKIEKEDEVRGEQPDPLSTAEDCGIVFEVIDEIPGIKLEEEATYPMEVISHAENDPKSMEKTTNPLEIKSDTDIDPLLKETTANSIVVKPDAGIELQLEVKDEIEIDPPAEGIEDSEDQPRDPLSRPQPKKRRKKSGPSRVIHYCPTHDYSIKLKQMKSVSDLNEFNQRLEDETFMKQVINYLQIETGETRADHLMNKSLDLLFNRQFLTQCGWRGRKSVSLPGYRKILELFSRLGATYGVNLPGCKVRDYFSLKCKNAKRRANQQMLGKVVDEQQSESEDESTEQTGGILPASFAGEQPHKRRIPDGSVRVVPLCLAHTGCTFNLKQVSSEPELDEFNRRLRNEEYMKQVINYLQFETGEERSDHLMNKSLDILFNRKFLATCTWRGINGKIPFVVYSKVQELFGWLGAKDGKRLLGCTVRDYFILKLKNAKRRAMLGVQSHEITGIGIGTTLEAEHSCCK